MRKLFFYIAFSIAIKAGAQVGVGTASPHASAAFEVKSNDKGMLVPRIALTAVNVAAPVSSPADALLVYNTASAGTGVNAVSPGFYYWNAAASKWMAIANTENSANAGTNIGFGSWGDCATAANISEYNPAVAPDGVDGDLFGSSVAISGNYAIVGAPSDDIIPYNDQGSVHIFIFDGTSWVHQQKLTSNDPSNGDNFGSAVSISGSYAVVGAPFDNVGVNTDQGSAYVFKLIGKTWTFQQKLTASDGAGNDKFGSSINMDGNSIIVGAPADDFNGNTDQGAAYVFTLSDGTWTQQQRLLPSDAGPNKSFGYSVGISGTFAIVGAPADDVNGNTDQGSAYIFSFNGSTWAQLPKLTASDGSPDDVFGARVAISGTNAVVSAIYDNIAINDDQGSVYVFRQSGLVWVQQQKIFASDGAQGDRFGFGLSISGNYIFAGADYDDFGTNYDQGSAYIFQNVNGVWRQLQKVSEPGGHFIENFGAAVAFDGSSKRFVSCAPVAVNARGIISFGKVN